jgi:hypothetical protein
MSTFLMLRAPQEYWDDDEMLGGGWFFQLLRLQESLHVWRCLVYLLQKQLQNSFRTCF